MAKRLDPKLVKWQDDLLTNQIDTDKWESKLFRASHRLEELRRQRKRLQREVAKHLATT